jgi:hypothetical protein
VAEKKKKKKIRDFETHGGLALPGALLQVSPSWQSRPTSPRPPSPTSSFNNRVKAVPSVSHINQSHCVRQRIHAYQQLSSHIAHAHHATRVQHPYTEPREDARIGIGIGIGIGQAVETLTEQQSPHATATAESSTSGASAAASPSTSMSSAGPPTSGAPRSSVSMEDSTPTVEIPSNPALTRASVTADRSS